MNINLHVDEIYKMSFDKAVSDSENLIILKNGIMALEAGVYNLVCENNGIEERHTVNCILESTPLHGYRDVACDSVNVKKDFIYGVDISSFLELNQAGAKYYINGVRSSLFSLLKKGGANLVRARLWVEPFDENGFYGGGNNDLENVITLGQISKKLGFRFLVDIHYSDFWADPAKQAIPKSWECLKTPVEIANKISEYTTEVLKKLEINEAYPDYVQVGNEITNGMIVHHIPKDYQENKSYTLLDDSIRGDFPNDNFVRYLKAGCEAVRSFDKNIPIIIHIDRGADYEYSEGFYDCLENNNIPYDIIGLSYYSFYHGDVKCLRENLLKLNERYNKKIVVCETSYAFTQDEVENNQSIFAGSTFSKPYEASPKGQVDLLYDIIDELNKIENGYGVIYWEPAWLPIKDHGWATNENCSWADQAFFDYEGNALPSLFAYKKIK